MSCSLSSVTSCLTCSLTLSFLGFDGLLLLFLARDHSHVECPYYGKGWKEGWRVHGQSRPCLEEQHRRQQQQCSPGQPGDHREVEVGLPAGT
jgi:hypothetical protein